MKKESFWIVALFLKAGINYPINQKGEWRNLGLIFPSSLTLKKKLVFFFFWVNAAVKNQSFIILML